MKPVFKMCNESIYRPQKSSVCVASVSVGMVAALIACASDLFNQQYMLGILL